jgi:hypothetical protein
MRSLALFALLLLPAQEDPVETRSYDVDFLTGGIEDRSGDGVGLTQEPIGTTLAADGLRAPMSYETLVELLRDNLDPDSWKEDGRTVRFVGGVLTITQKKSVQERIAGTIRYLQDLLAKRISIDAAFVSIEPALLAKIRAEGDPDRPSALSPKQRAMLMDAAREGKQAELVKSMRRSALPGQRISLQDLTKRSYVRDYDVQIATGDGGLDPIVDVLATGPSLDVRPLLELFEGGITLEIRGDFVEFEAMDVRNLRIGKMVLTPVQVEPEAAKPVVGAKEPATLVPLEYKVQLPKIQHDKVRTMLTVRDRETAIAASVLRKNRAFLFLVTPAIAAPEEKPAGPPAGRDRQLRVFDVTALVRRIQSWPGPDIDLPSPSRGGGGPLTGARFTLDEPAILLNAEDLDDLIRARIAPATWEDAANSIEKNGTTLTVRHKPEVMREIERLLADASKTHATTVTTEAVVVGFRNGARAEWEKEIPALAGGTTADAAAIAKLLEEAARGKGVRLIDAAEVTAFPGQRVHVLRSRQEAYLQDYEPQVSTFVSILDPIMGIFYTGSLMDVRAQTVFGSDAVNVEFRFERSSGEMKEMDALGVRAGAIQTPQAKTQKWTTTVHCPRGKWALASLESAGDAEEIAVFVRARKNVFK